MRYGGGVWWSAVGCELERSVAGWWRVVRRGEWVRCGVAVVGCVAYRGVLWGVSRSVRCGGMRAGVECQRVRWCAVGCR